MTFLKELQNKDTNKELESHRVDWVIGGCYSKLFASVQSPEGSQHITHGLKILYLNRIVQDSGHVRYAFIIHFFVLFFFKYTDNKLSYC